MTKPTAQSRIYRLEFDPAYQSLALADPALLATPLLHFDSTSKASVWEPIDLVVADCDKPEPDFWQLTGLPVGFVCKEKVLGEVQTLENISFRACHRARLRAGARCPALCLAVGNTRRRRSLAVRLSCVPARFYHDDVGP